MRLGTMNFVSPFRADEDLVGREDHVFESFDGSDGFDFTSVLLQDVTESVPLAAGFHAVHGDFTGHVGVFLIDYIEIIDEPGHTLCMVMMVAA